MKEACRSVDTTKYVAGMVHDQREFISQELNPSGVQIAQASAVVSSASSGSLSSPRRGYRIIVPITAAIDDAMKIAIFAAA